MFIHRWELGLLSPFVYCKQSTMNTSVQHLFESLLSKLWGVCPGGIAGSYDHSVLFCFVFFFLPFRASPTAYGDSQAGDLIGVIAAGLHHSHSNTRSGPHLQPTPHGILNPLSKGRDRTGNLMVLSQICFRCSATGMPMFDFLRMLPTLPQQLYHFILPPERCKCSSFSTFLLILVTLFFFFLFFDNNQASGCKLVLPWLFCGIFL